MCEQSDEVMNIFWISQDMFHDVVVTWCSFVFESVMTSPCCFIVVSFAVPCRSLCCCYDMMFLCFLYCHDVMFLSCYDVVKSSSLNTDVGYCQS